MCRTVSFGQLLNSCLVTLLLHASSNEVVLFCQFATLLCDDVSSLICSIIIMQWMAILPSWGGKLPPMQSGLSSSPNHAPTASKTITVTVIVVLYVHVYNIIFLNTAVIIMYIVYMCGFVRLLPLHNVHRSPIQKNDGCNHMTCKTVNILQCIVRLLQ